MYFGRFEFASVTNLSRVSRNASSELPKTVPGFSEVVACWDPVLHAGHMPEEGKFPTSNDMAHTWGHGHGGHGSMSSRRVQS